MQQDINPTTATRTARRAAVAAAIVVTACVLALSFAASAARILPPPTTTTIPRPTTTLAPSRTTTTPPGPTSTTRPSTQPTTTVPPTPAPTTTGTVVASSSSMPPVTAPSTTTGTTQPLPEPPTSPPPTVPVAEPFIFASPVEVDPEDPTVHPPVIVGATTWCQGNFPEGQIRISVQNVDLYHYPAPFEANYEWTLDDGDGWTASGAFTLAGWETRTIGLSVTAAGPMTFTVTDVDLGPSATADLDVPDCVNAPPPPVADPLGPIIVVAAVACSEDINASSGGGYFRFHVHNQPGDDGTSREYDFAVSWMQTTVTSGTTDPVFDGSWAEEDVKFVHSGTFMVTVTDHDDPALTATSAVDVPECPPAPPPPDDPGPPAAPSFIKVSTTCADPVLLDGRVDFVVLNPNWPFLGLPGELTYDFVFLSGSSAVDSFQGWFYASGEFASFRDSLSPGEYTATINAASYPELGDSVTFTIDDCAVNPQPAPVPLEIFGLTTVCLPGDDSESVLWAVQHSLGAKLQFGWVIRDDAQDLVALDGSVQIFPDDATLLSARALPVGTMHLTVTNPADPAVTATASFDIAACAAPVGPIDPTDPADTTDPADPADTTDPGDPVDTSDPGDPGTTSPVDDATGTLPPTALTGALPATR